MVLNINKKFDIYNLIYYICFKINKKIMPDIHFNISNEKLDTIITNTNTFQDYYKQMYNEIDLIHEDEELFVYSPNTFANSEFFDGGIESDIPCHWDSSNVEEIFNANVKNSVMYRIHFLETEQKFNFTYYFDIKNNKSVFQDCSGNNYSDIELEEVYPQYVEQIKNILPLIEEDFKMKSYRWLRSGEQDNLKAKFDLDDDKILKTLVDRIINYKRISTISILNLLMFSNTNTSAKFSELVSLTSEDETTEIKSMELFLMVSSLGARFYSFDELKSEIKDFNKNHKK